MDISGADLRNAQLFRANFYKTNLKNAILINANLTGTNFYKTNLISANLSGANLQHAGLVKVEIENTILTGCKLYGLAAWDLLGEPAEQSNLIITNNEVSMISVDNLQLAQFIYLLLNNENIRSIIDTITSKTILILGRFTKERKEVLDAIRTTLSNLNFTPIIFDFDKPNSKDVTGTVETLARMARFIIAYITDPSSIPHELATLVPHLRTTPIQLLKQKGTNSYSMLNDYLGAYKWLIAPYEYIDSKSLISDLVKIITPADNMAKDFRK